MKTERTKTTTKYYRNRLWKITVKEIPIGRYAQYGWRVIKFYESRDTIGSAWITRNVSISENGDAYKLETAKVLIQDVVNQHSDKDSCQYNGCDVPGEECQWCVTAKTILK